MRLLLVALAAGFLFVLPTAPAQAAACAAPAYPSVNGRYTSEIKAKHLSCEKAYKLLTKQYTCRVKNGPAGRCVKKVMHFACMEERYSDFYSGTFVSAVTCKHNNKKVSWSFEQSNTVA